MRFHAGVGTRAASVQGVLVVAVLWGTTALLAAEPAELVRQIETKLSSAQRQTATSPSQAERDCLLARDLLGQLREASPSHEKLSSLQKRFDDLKGKLEKRLGRPLGGSVESSAAPITPTEPQVPASDLPSAVVSQLKKIDAALTAATASLEKNQLQTANRRLDEARKLMAEVQSRYGAMISADGKVYLHGVHLAADRQSDGSWGSLYGHVTWTDWMAEKNVNKEPPTL